MPALALVPPPPNAEVDAMSEDRILVALAEIKGNIDTLTATMTQRADGHSKDLADHEDRLRVLERGRWPLPAVAALVSLASLAVAWYAATH